MSDPLGSLVQELIDLPLKAFRQRAEQGFPIPVGKIAEAMRGEAARYYHANAAKALQIARKTLELGHRSAEPLAIGWGNRAMAEALFLSGRLGQAEPFYEAAASAWKAVHETALLGQLLVSRTHLHALLGRYRESEKAAGEARRYLEAAGDQVYLAKLAMNLGNVHFQRDEHGPALEEYNRARKIFSRLRVRDQSVIGVEINQGIALSQLDREEEALALFQSLERECERLRYDLLLAQVRMNAAYVHSQRADFDLALRCLGSAADYFHRTEHPAFLGACRLNRAEIYHQLNLHREALELAEQAIPLFSREGMTYDRALATSQSAISQLALGNPAKALSRIRQGRALFEKDGNESRVALMGLLEAETLARRRRVSPEAEQLARKSMETFRELRLLRWEAGAAILMGRLEEKRRLTSQQIPRLQALLSRVSGRIYPMTAYRILETLGGAQERSGKIQAALDSYRRAVRHLEDIRIRIPTEESKIAFLQDKTHLYDRLLALEASRSHPSVDRIFEWMERSRAQSLWDRLRNPSAYLRHADALGRSRGEDRRLTTLRRRLTWLHTRISHLELGSPAERAKASALHRELAKAEGVWSRALRETQEVGKGIRRSQARSGIPSTTAKTIDRPDSRTADRKPPTLQDVSRALPSGWGFAGFHVGPGIALVLVATEGGRTWRRLTPDLGPRLQRLADRLDFQWNAAALASVRRGWAEGAHEAAIERDRVLLNTTQSILVELYDLLWRPIDEVGFSRVRKWVICPHGPIHRIPIHALWNQREYLASRYDFSTVPSVRTWARLPVRRCRRTPVAWVGGLASSRLPAVEAEVDRVRRRLAGWQVQHDLSPTAQTLRDQGSRADLIHLAVHGSLRTDNPAYSYLLLADGPLFVHDLAGFRFPNSTVVLSACSSGRGAAPVGDEWIGLAQGFIQAGASSVVASLWPIDEMPTLELMDVFYERYEAGAAPPEAMGEACRRVLPAHLHPWAWASFGVLGGLPFRPNFL